jgi:hypothetical protein
MRGQRLTERLAPKLKWLARYILIPVAVTVLGGIVLVLITTPTPPDIRITRIDASASAGQKDYLGECVVIKNFGASAVNMTNWTLEDAGAKHRFTFPEFTLNPSASVEVWTMPGTPSATQLHWGRTTSVWDNDGDTASLRDHNGALIAEKAY